VTRLLRSLLIAVIVIVTITFGALWLLLGTARGGQWLVAQAATFVPGELLIEAQDGSVLSGLTAGRVVYRDEALVVELTDMRIDIRLSGALRKRIVIESLTAAAASIDVLHLTDIGLSGSIELRDEFPLTAKLRWNGAAGRISGSGEFSGDLANLEFTHQVELPATVDVTGVAHALLTQPSINVTASFTELPLVVGEEQVVIRDGYIVLSGTTEMLMIERAEAAAFDGHVSVTGSVGIEEEDAQAGLTAVLEIVGVNLDPATVYPDLEGRLDFTLSVDAHSIDDIDVVLDYLSGEFLGTPVAGTGSVHLREGLVERVALELRSGQNRLEVSGETKPDFAGVFRLDFPEFETLWPGAEGSLEGAGRFGGTLEEPIVSVRLDGTRFSFGELSIEHIHVDGRVDATGELDWNAQAKDARNGELNLGNLQLRVRGMLEDHWLAARISDGAVGAQLQARGAWDGERLQAKIESAVINGGAVGEWTLHEAVSAWWAADDVSIDAHCWDSSRAEICTDGMSWRDGRWIATATLRRFPLATFEPWLGEDLRVSGEADADLAIDWKEGSPLVVDASWHQGETRISFSADDVSPQPDEIATTLSDVRFALTANENVATLEGYVTGEYGLAARISGSLDDPFGDDGQLAGRVAAQIPDIGELRPLINRFLLTSAVGGAIEVTAEISGTIAAPVIEGRAELRDGSAGLAINGIELTDANLSVSGQAGDAFKVEGSVRSGEGLVRVDGQIDVFGEHDGATQLRLTGDDFEALRLPDLRMVVAPDIELSLVGGNFMISGRVFVPEAEFVVHELGQSAVTISPDVVVHDEQQPRQPRTPGPRIVGSLDLQLGDNVRFSGLGIDTRVTGGLLLVETVNKPLAAEGSLQLVDGRYEMFGKVLTIEQGSLNFYGPLDDPVLDVRAARRVRYQGQTIRAGVIVSGRITRQLDFLLFSDPLYSDEDILSYLLVDRPASTADGVDGTAISGAAVAMGLQSLTGGVGEGLSLDEVGLEGAGGDDTAVVAGKRLGEDVYIRYSYGLFNRIGTLLVRYELGRGFSIEAGSGEQQSLDLLYWIDR